MNAARLELLDQNTLVGEPPAPPADEGPYEPGMLVADHYRLVRRLGHGGMGHVWLAEHQSTGARVAIKISVDTDPAVARRALREAEIISRASHPGVVKVLDARSSDDGPPLVVMELLDGDDLTSRLDPAITLRADIAVELILPILDALQHIHSLGIVHRDIKPENIFLAVDGGTLRPKLLDFGIAKMDTIERLTRTGECMGTPVYMSPEQAAGRTLDHRTDLWSTCVVLYELITGEAPFVADNYHALLQCIIHREPAHLPALTERYPALWRIVQRGLNKDIDKRFGSADELSQALRAWLEGFRDGEIDVELPAEELTPPPLPAFDMHALSLPPPPMNRRPLRQYVMALGILLLFLTGAAVVGSRGDAAPATARDAAAMSVPPDPDPVTASAPNATPAAGVAVQSLRAATKATTGAVASERPHHAVASQPSSAAHAPAAAPAP